VSFEGTLTEGLKACLWSRVAMRVLLQVGEFQARTADELYAGARAIDWAAHLDTRATLAVSATVRDNPALAHTGFAALKTKDAVVDALRDKLGARPDVNAEDPDVPLVLHVEGPQARLYLDLAGAPLHRRGYRVAMTEAPLKENLAAAMLALGGADTTAPFLDPMAGSGTLAIEQALRARNIAPGLRRKFAFERWPSQAHGPDWQRLRAEAEAAALPRAPAPILARDAEAAGVAADLTFEAGDVRGLRPPHPTGTLVTNPPYGQRMDSDAALYGDLADTLQRFAAWRLVLLSGSPQLGRVFLRKADITHRLWNGPLETRLLVYQPRDR
jgi:23S rRNA G2445 N2-methylase RlmL